MMVYICTKFHENILDGSKERTNFHGKNFKGGNSVKNVGGVMFFFLCTLSDGGLYFYKVS